MQFSKGFPLMIYAATLLSYWNEPLETAMACPALMASLIRSVDPEILIKIFYTFPVLDSCRLSCQFALPLLVLAAISPTPMSVYWLLWRMIDATVRYAGAGGSLSWSCEEKTARSSQDSTPQYVIRALKASLNAIVAFPPPTSSLTINIMPD